MKRSRSRAVIWIPAGLKKHGLASKGMVDRDDSGHHHVDPALYPRGPGCEIFERELAKLERKAVKQILTGKTKTGRDYRRKISRIFSACQNSANGEQKPRIRSAL